MNYLRIYLNSDDDDIRQIWNDLPENEKGAYVKAAIRRRAREEEPEHAGLTAEDVRAVVREELSRIQIAGPATPADEREEEDDLAAEKILRMF